MTNQSRLVKISDPPAACQRWKYQGFSRESVSALSEVRTSLPATFATLTVYDRGAVAFPALISPRSSDRQSTLYEPFTETALFLQDCPRNGGWVIFLMLYADQSGTTNNNTLRNRRALIAETRGPFVGSCFSPNRPLCSDIKISANTSPYAS